jgi:hypothetical protein
MVLYTVYKKGVPIDLPLSKIVELLYAGELDPLDNTIKTKISQYEERIPLYDIYTNKIYLVYKDNIYKRVVFGHYRLPDKSCNAKNKDIMNNYDLKELQPLFYKLFYLSLPKNTTLCKRPSFSPLLPHIEPYYSEQELLRFSYNNNLIKDNQEQDKIDYVKLCSLVSKNDISFEHLLQNQNYIYKQNKVGLVKNYSLNGAFYMNNYLRKTKTPQNEAMEQQIKMLNELIVKSPPLKGDFVLYRFIRDDSYLKHLHVGDTYIENSFISCTRDPFYYETMGKHVFGFILLKIKIAKGSRVLFLESYSNFSYEQEVLLPVGAQLVLDNIAEYGYYALEHSFRKKVTHVYEFTYKKTVPIKIKPRPKPDIQLVDLFSDTMSVLELIESQEIATRSEKFIHLFGGELFQFESIVGKRKKTFFIESYDSSNLYKPFFYYSVKNGIMIYTLSENGAIELLIELGEEIHINYYFKHSISQVKLQDSDELLKWISMLAYHLRIEQIIIHPDYASTNDTAGDFYQSISHPVAIYEYLKNKTIYFKQNTYVTHNCNYLQLDYLHTINADKILSVNDHDELFEIYQDIKQKVKTVSQLYMYIIENKPLHLKQFLKKLDRIFPNNNPFDDLYYKLNAFQYLYDLELISKIPQLIIDNEIDDIKLNKLDNKMAKIKIPRIYNRQRLII